MKNRSSESLNSTRRGFLHSLLAAAGGVFAMTAAGKVVAEDAAPEDKTAQPESQGYRETDHIRAYYRTARF